MLSTIAYKIPNHLQDRLWYDPSLTAICRLNNARQPLNQGIEFIYVLEQIIGQKFDEHNFDSDEGEKGFDESKVKCICGHTITHLYTIFHKETGIRFLVGSHCIKKVSNELYCAIMKGKCKCCEKPLTDKRTLYQKDGFCSCKCYNSKTIICLECKISITTDETHLIYTNYCQQCYYKQITCKYCENQFNNGESSKYNGCCSYKCSNTKTIICLECEISITTNEINLIYTNYCQQCYYKQITCKYCENQFNNGESSRNNGCCSYECYIKNFHMKTIVCFDCETTFKTDENHLIDTKYCQLCYSEHDWCKFCKKEIKNFEELSSNNNTDKIYCSESHRYLDIYKNYRQNIEVIEGDCIVTIPCTSKKQLIKQFGNQIGNVPQFHKVMKMWYIPIEELNRDLLFKHYQRNGKQIIQNKAVYIQSMEALQLINELLFSKDLIDVKKALFYFLLNKYSNKLPKKIKKILIEKIENPDLDYNLKYFLLEQLENE